MTFTKWSSGHIHPDNPRRMSCLHTIFSWANGWAIKSISPLKIFSIIVTKVPKLQEVCLAIFMTAMILNDWNDCFTIYQSGEVSTIKNEILIRKRSLLLCIFFFIIACCSCQAKEIQRYSYF